jgi:hypothetical protein
VKNRNLALTLATTLVIATGASADSRNDGGKKHAPDIVQLGDARMKFEINATDGDGGIQIFLDADPWRWMNIFDPRGKLVFASVTAGSIGANGGTELFLESGEPAFTELSLKDLLKRFPAGEYRFRGRGLEGERFVGSAMLTHNLPDGPRLVYPLENSGGVNPSNAVLLWEKVAPPNGSPIIAYQVLVVQPDTGIKALPKKTLDVMMPATATTMTVPPGFLRPNTRYEWEVLAIEAGGNQTLSSAFFTTSP